jgi:crooked neck
MLHWIQYAHFEESQREFERARSIFERGIDSNYRHPPLWIKYAEMELRHKNVNRARNIYDRAVVLLPRVSQLWFKYVFMEEMLEQADAARLVFQRWMQWQPPALAWHAFIAFERRHGETERARQILRRLVDVHPDVASWLKWAKFEERLGAPDRARAVFEAAVTALGDDAHTEHFFVTFAQFEERQKETERCRAIYKYALDHIPKHLADELYQRFVNFEKQHGERDGIEDVIVSKRRFQYEEELKRNAKDYDTWFDYIRLEEEAGSEPARARELYERAVAQVPPIAAKTYWRRYIYLWLKYAVFEELVARDMERARAVYRKAIELVPHKKFSFGKLWLLFAHFEVRQKNLLAARQVLGHALGVAPSKEKICTAYIALETQLGEIDRCRTLHEKLLEFAPTSTNAWLRFAAFEQRLGESERARALLELCVTRPALDLPEMAWKTFIDFETELGEYDRARDLYERLLERTKHVKVWLSYAAFEASVAEVARSRALLLKAFALFKTPSTHEQRYLVFEQWSELEAEVGDEQAIAEVKKNVPRKVKKRRKIVTDDGTDAGWEEYFDYVFPDEEDSKPHLRLLEAARRWKEQQAAAAAAAGEQPADVDATN